MNQDDKTSDIKDLDNWSFLCREIAKLNNIIFAYDKIFRNI